MVWDNTWDGMCRKTIRTLNETIIEGVKTNMLFVTNIVKDDVFLSGDCNTSFIDAELERLCK
jgi:pyruvate carboxylase